MENDAAKKIYARNLLKDATQAMSPGKESPEVSPCKEEELALLRESTVMRLRGMTVRKSDQGGPGGRLVGVDDVDS